MERLEKIKQQFLCDLGNKASELKKELNKYRKDRSKILKNEIEREIEKQNEEKMFKIADDVIYYFEDLARIQMDGRMKYYCRQDLVKIVSKHLGVEEDLYND